MEEVGMLDLDLELGFADGAASNYVVVGILSLYSIVRIVPSSMRVSVVSSPELSRVWASLPL